MKINMASWWFPVIGIIAVSLLPVATPVTLLLGGCIGHLFAMAKLGEEA